MTTEEKKTQFDLQLNETLYAEMCWGVRTDITRVPDGWIYQTFYRHHDGRDDRFNPVFVPEKPKDLCKEHGHNMFSVYALNNHQSYWGLHKCSRCEHTEHWQYDLP